ncbi:MAG: LytTR family DNA-binding domain-containing protein [Acidobacteriota bacterium]|nr:LytTR family DNA-binding domain-containing protein [Acidobacteriota bacterium]
MTLRALIVDDEPLARESLRLLLSAHSDIEVEGEASHGREALAMIRRRRPDLLFLDVQMPGMSGLELLRKIGPIDPITVIFVTAFDRYAIQAFESRALDYLLKPFTDERFEQVLARARRHARDRTLTQLGAKVFDLLGADGAQAVGSAVEAEAQGRRDTILIKEGARTTLIPISDIDWFEAADYYTTVHTAGKARLLRETITSLASTLDPATFVRVHRSAIVNVTRIVELESHAAGDATAILAGGTRVRVSRTFRASLLASLSK